MDVYLIIVACNYNQQVAGNFQIIVQNS